MKVVQVGKTGEFDHIFISRKENLKFYGVGSRGGWGGGRGYIYCMG